MSARNQDTLDALIAQLAMNCGDLFDACGQIGVSPLFITRWRKDDAEVNAQIAEAEMVGSLRLESAAIKRAVDGVEKAVYYQGDVVGYDIVRSDGLLGKLLDAKRPGFGKDGGAGGNTFNGPVQVNLMPRADTMEQWLEMKASMGNRALNAPTPKIEDATYEEVPSPQFAGLGF